MQGCALAEPGGPWHLTFALGWLENLRFFIQIICWAPWILQVQSTGLPSIFLRAQPCKGSQFRYYSILIYFIVQSWTLERNDDNTCFLGSLLFLSSGIRQVTVKKPRLGIMWLTMTTHLLQSSSSFTAPFSMNSGDEWESLSDQYELNMLHRAVL